MGLLSWLEKKSGEGLEKIREQRMEQYLQLDLQISALCIHFNMMSPEFSADRISYKNFTYENHSPDENAKAICAIGTKWCEIEFAKLRTPEEVKKRHAELNQIFLLMIKQANIKIP